MINHGINHNCPQAVGAMAPTGVAEEAQCWNCKGYGHLARDCQAPPPAHLRHAGSTGAEVIAYVYRMHMEELETEDPQEEEAPEEAPDDEP